MDFEYDGADDLGGRVLWGRIAVLGAIGLLLLLLGRCTAGGGADPGQVEELQSELADANAVIAERDATITSLQQEIVDLREQIRVLSGEGEITGGDGTGTEGGDTGDGTDTGGDTPTEGQVYVVQPGDTLSSIAEAVYGDPLAFGVIASANGITEDNPLQVGQELTIPPNPDG